MCSFGSSVLCYEDLPPIAKIVGTRRYVTDMYFPSKKCDQAPSEIYANPLDTCVNLWGDNSYAMTCKNNVVMYYGYNKTACATTPFTEFSLGVPNQCNYPHYYQCY